MSRGEFLGGAAIAAGLVFAVLVGCRIAAHSIAQSSTSAPSLLLVLPGLVATYIGRPDQHALTTRLLSFARYLLLLLSGATALFSAAVVALGSPQRLHTPALASRAHLLSVVFEGAGAVALAVLIGLLVGYVRALPRFWQRWRPSRLKLRLRNLRLSQFTETVPVALSPDRAFALAHQLVREKELLGPRSDLFKAVPEARLIEAYRVDWFGTWLLKLGVTEASGDASSVTLRVDLVCPRPLRPLLPILLRRERRAARERLRHATDGFGHDILPSVGDRRPTSADGDMDRRALRPRQLSRTALSMREQSAERSDEAAEKTPDVAVAHRAGRAPSAVMLAAHALETAPNVIRCRAELRFRRRRLPAAVPVDAVSVDSASLDSSQDFSGDPSGEIFPVHDGHSAVPSLPRTRSCAEHTPQVKSATLVPASAG